MLEIETEFRKGILFVRLKGELSKNTVGKLHQDVTDMIKDNGIKNVVFNVNGLNTIDMKGINSLMYNYELSKSLDGKTLICGLDNRLVKHRVEHSRLLHYLYETSDELGAFQIIDR